MDWFKRSLTHIGSHCSDRFIHQFNASLNYLAAGHWLRSKGYYPSRRQRPIALFDAVASQVKDERVLYIELGVHKGASMRYWAEHLRHPQSSLHGFDSFVGLPEFYNLGNPEGHFDVGGATPDIADPRVQFFPGWFKDTLPKYAVPEHDRLIINFDADLYSSTMIGLDTFEEYIVPGTFLFFDEFCDRAHELRAFDEFLQKSPAVFRLIGADEILARVAFERTA